MSNAAKKIIEVDLSNKWPVGTVIVERDGKNEGRAYHRSAAVIRLYLGNDRVELLHATGRTTSATIGHVQNKYKIATAEEASIFAGAQVGAYADSAMGESLGDTVPRGPRSVKANDEEPKSEPAAAPPSAIERQSDISILAMFRDIQSDMRREFNERFDKQEQARREETRALHESIRLTNATVAAVLGKLGGQALPQATPSTVAESDKEKQSRELKERHKRIFKGPLETFITSEMVRVDPATESGRSLALESGQFYELFAAWCAKRKDLTEKPYQAAIYSLLNSKQHRSPYKVQTSDDKVLTSYAPKSTRQTSINFNDQARPIEEAMEVVQFARTIWGDSANKHMDTVVKFIETKRFTKQALLLALRRQLGLKGSDRKYTPEEIFTEDNLQLLLNDEVRARAGVGK